MSRKQWSMAKSNDVEFEAFFISHLSPREKKESFAEKDAFNRVCGFALLLFTVYLSILRSFSKTQSNAKRTIKNMFEFYSKETFSTKLNIRICDAYVCNIFFCAYMVSCLGCACVWRNETKSIDIMLVMNLAYLNP